MKDEKDPERHPQPAAKRKSLHPSSFRLFPSPRLCVETLSLSVSQCCKDPLTGDAAEVSLGTEGLICPLSPNGSVVR